MNNDPTNDAQQEYYRRATEQMERRQQTDAGTYRIIVKVFWGAVIFVGLCMLMGLISFLGSR